MPFFLISTCTISGFRAAINKKVLVAPLNWGLGHATRCIPIIRELIRQGAEVYLASDGAALTLLKLEFPELRIFELPSYGIRYATGKLLPLKMPAPVIESPETLTKKVEEGFLMVTYLSLIVLKMHTMD